MANKNIYRKNDRTAPSKPWFQPPPPLGKDRHIAIIGAGIAGLVTALALQKNGYQVTIFNRDERPMNGASGNPAGILDPHISLGKSPENVFYHAALFHALDYYHSLDPDILLVKGLTGYPARASEQQRFVKFHQQNHLPPEFMSISPDGILHFPQLGAISPPRIREILAGQLSIRNGKAITRIRHHQKWHLYNDETECAVADAVIICCGADSISFADIPLDPVRGQITLLDGGGLDGGVNTPTGVLCGKGYIIPPVRLDGRMTIVTGASFQRNDRDRSLRPEDHRENLANAGKLWPEITSRAITGGRCAIRAYSPDHMPVCGPLPDFPKYHAAYEMLKHGPKHQDYINAPYQPNLYILSGLGARGFLSAPLLGDMLSALISGTPPPLPEAICQSLHPGRFMIRKLIKGK
ncbi:hypothetical protein MNBD_ALPHA01-1275 [hydrothermal vent metagenome]|uniref:FAD dependent oxidoreductase domain-containing protein n=1 Tax=hydrothermal vent metagenome TaxID=652676 RepID=A0A3B0SZG3_9ZZZZ